MTQNVSRKYPRNANGNRGGNSLEVVARTSPKTKMPPTKRAIFCARVASITKGAKRNAKINPAPKPNNAPTRLNEVESAKGLDVSVEAGRRWSGRNQTARRQPIQNAKRNAD